MVTVHPYTDKTKNNDSSEKFTENSAFKVEDINWLIDYFPVTVFRSSSKLSWGFDYIYTNVEKLTGYSKMDFIEQKLVWSDIVLPEDSSVVEKAVKKAKKNKSSYQVEYRIKKADGSIDLFKKKLTLFLMMVGNLIIV
jgi:methyl-accepting chemotaxis protein